MRSSIHIAILASVVAMLSVSTVSAGPIPKQCNEACSREYNPVCGIAANGESKVFANPCTFDVHNCNNPNLVFVQADMTKCEEPKENCPQMCTTDYNPICGVAANGESRTFSNPCTFNIHNCKNPDQAFVWVAQGECEESEQCHEVCTKEYNPVCGRGPNGAFQTFGNPCTFEAHNCKNPTQAFAEVEMSKCAKPKKCNEACTMEYKPVCTRAENNKSSEFKIFPNACFLSVHNCENPNLVFVQADMTKCEEPKENCPQMCTTDYNPICGVAANGESRTFSNPCTFNIHNCKNPDQAFVQVAQSECP